MKKLFAKIAIITVLIAQLATPVFACPQPEPHTQGYWKNHVYELCNNNLQNIAFNYYNELFTWQDVQEILNTPAKGDAWYILAHQWVSYNLNLTYQGCPWGSEICEAKEYLNYGPGNIPKNLRPLAIDLAEKFDAYNNGCFDQ